MFLIWQKFNIFDFIFRFTFYFRKILLLCIFFFWIFKEIIDYFTWRLIFKLYCFFSYSFIFLRDYYYYLSVFFCCNFVLGLSNAAIRIFRVTYIFKLVPNHVIGRVNVILNLASYFFRFLWTLLWNFFLIFGMFNRFNNLFRVSFWVS